MYHTRHGKRRMLWLVLSCVLIGCILASPLLQTIPSSLYFGQHIQAVSADEGTPPALEGETPLAFEAGTTRASGAELSRALEAGTTRASEGGTSPSLEGRTSPSLEADPSLTQEAAQYEEWIMQWQQPMDDFQVEHWPEWEVLQFDAKRHLYLVRVADDVDRREWYAYWSEHEHVQYVEPNYTVKPSWTHDGAGILPNDTYIELQYDAYLEQINAPEGWEIETDNHDITIAVVDTGIDLEHPDLYDNLIPGLNMVELTQPPQDTEGHGTQVAGVLGAMGNNERGVTGILWSTNIMPVKVLEEDRDGNTMDLVNGIHEAVDQGASIIVLSLGDYMHNHTLQNAVEYAEAQGVFVVAAVGNKSREGRYNDLLQVQYPAAFPTVFAVGAVDGDGLPAEFTIPGPEVDVVAPGQVYTTDRNGEYAWRYGTSMAAPQVAGLAALLLRQYPDMTPAELRNHIRYTSQPVGEERWDPYTGYGLIDMHAALTTPPVADIYMSNDTMEEAAVFPFLGRVDAALQDGEDMDWFTVETPYAGTLHIDIELESGKMDGVEVVVVQNENEDVHQVHRHGRIRLETEAGHVWIGVRYHDDERRQIPLTYSLTNSFTIYADEQQPNDTMEAATRLSEQSDLIGTFHEVGLADWYYIDLDRPGEVDLQITVDTIRVRPVVHWYKPDGSSQRLEPSWDIFESGQKIIAIDEAEAGRHYFEVAEYAHQSVIGEYDLSFRFWEYFDDP